MSERLLFRSDRADGRFVSTAGLVHAYMKAHPPKLQFDPGMPAEKFPAWQQSVRDKLREIMHFPEVPPQPPPRIEIIDIENDEPRQKQQGKRGKVSYENLGHETPAMTYGERQNQRHIHGGDITRK